jgi:phosphoribosylformylglycinamidine synthase
VLKIPIAHGEGNYFADAGAIASLHEHNQIVFRYCSNSGEIDDAANPNGSLLNIAGIMNKEGNVLGMMPHPERACEPMLGSADGKKIFQSMIESLVLS